MENLTISPANLEEMVIETIEKEVLDKWTGKRSLSEFLGNELTVESVQNIHSSIESDGTLSKCLFKLTYKIIMNDKKIQNFKRLYEKLNIRPDAYVYELVIKQNKNKFITWGYIIQTRDFQIQAVPILSTEHVSYEKPYYEIFKNTLAVLLTNIDKDLVH